MTTARETVYDLNLPPLARQSLGRTVVDPMLQLIAFHHTYDVPMHPLGSEDREFKHMDNDRVALRVNLILEEVHELLTDGLGIETIPDQITFDDLAAGKRDGAQVADALGDIVYVCYGFALELGYDLRDVIAEIHAANLTKLGEDGKPILRDDGKVLKGPNYHAPNIEAALGWEDNVS